MNISDTIIRDAIREAVKVQLDDVRLISLPRAAELLDVSPETARRLIKRGVDVGGKGLKVSLADVRRVQMERAVKL
jgi:predicted HTH domain antitoxin